MGNPNKIDYPSGQPPASLDVLWRVEARRYAYVINGDYDEWGVTAPKLEARWCEVTKRTPKGAWIREYFGDKKFVRLTAHKRYACNTLEEALESFVARRKCQIAILRKQLARAEADLALLKEAA